MNEIEILNFRDMHITTKLTILSTNPKNVSCDDTYVSLKFGNNAEMETKMTCTISAKNFRGDININDYIEEENHNDYFKAGITITARIFKKSGQKADIISATKYTNIRDNSEFSFQVSVTSYTMIVHIMLRCYGYTGKNCETKNIKSSKYYRHPQTKAAICRNDGDCGDEACKDDSMCLNRGKCFIKTFGYQKEYCVCNDGYYGIHCEKKFVNPKLTEEYLLFGDNSQLTNTYSMFKDCKGCAYTPCQKYEKYIVCFDTAKDGSLSNCDKEYIEEVCGKDICVSINPNDNYEKCYYLKSAKEKCTKIRAEKNNLLSEIPNTSENLPNNENFQYNIESIIDQSNLPDIPSIENYEKPIFKKNEFFSI